MKDDKVTFSDDFNQGFGFGMGFCMAATCYGIVWAILGWLTIAELAKSALP